ncbi:MAG: DUF2752 domain-containing protein [Elusimicrobia bacterium]|nr:DUF2752 domain-containing protein [Elusimicrobiota bacterium]MDE2509524.1 DUF2752 domain-containing protein [Elusimicrobiota bacterium]
MKRPLSFPQVASAAYAALAAQAASGAQYGGTLCPFRLLTGHPCPGCGMGHALVAGMRGDWAASFRYHPLGLPLLAVWTGWLGWGFVNAWRGRAFSEGFVPALRRPAFTWAALIAVLAVYAVRSA